MIFPKALKSICWLFLLFALVACRPITKRLSEPTEVLAPLSALGKELESQGYRVMKCITVSPTSWEATKFRMRGKQLTAFKAEKRLANETENYYVRFSFAEETYDSNEDARRRLAQLHKEFPDAPWEDEYTRAMREGFLIDRTAYILQTDAAIFWPEIKRLTKLLAESRGGERVPSEQ
jgi:hypothetical protein